MTATMSEAQGDMLAVLKSVTDSLGVVVIYESKQGSVPDSGSWIRPSIKHSFGGQASLSGATGKKRWNRIGTLWVQVFVEQGQGLDPAYQIAQPIVNAFQKARTPHNVWFKNMRIVEVGPSGAFFQVNTLIDFSYDQID